MSLEQAKANSQAVQQMALSSGLEIHFETMILTNTFDAHRLVMYADQFGLMHEMMGRILRAYFAESKHIGDHDTLTELAVEVGLDRDAVAAMLASDEKGADVRADEQEAGQLGIGSVPFFLINRKYGITGAQSEETFINALQKVLMEESAKEQ